MLTFEVGQKVAVDSPLMSNPQGPFTVKRVMKRFIELDDGSKWCIGGRHRYPYERGRSSMASPHMEPWTQAHSRKRALCDVRYKIYEYLDEVKAYMRDSTDVEALAALFEAVKTWRQKYVTKT